MTAVSDWVSMRDGMMKDCVSRYQAEGRRLHLYSSKDDLDGMFATKGDVHKAM